MSQYVIFWVSWGTKNYNIYFLSQNLANIDHFRPFLRTSGEKITTLDSYNLYKTNIFLKLEAM